MKEKTSRNNKWIDLPLGFVSLEEAQVWTKALEQAQERIESLRLIELIFNIENIFKTYEMIDHMTIELSRETNVHEVVIWVKDIPLEEKEKESSVKVSTGVKELGTLFLTLFHSDPINRIGPLSVWHQLEELQSWSIGMNQHLKDHSAILRFAPLLWPFSAVKIQKNQSDWRSICNTLGASNAILSIEHAQLESETRHAKKQENDSERDHRAL